MTISEKITYCTTKIISFNNGICSVGTGFFMDLNVNKEEKTCTPVIITNKHVIEETDRVTISVCKSDENDSPIDNERLTMTIENPTIIKHPDDEVDLCAILIAPLINFASENNIRLYRGRIQTDIIISNDEINNSTAIEDIIMVGYPIGLEDKHNNKPIIRKGITSTHIKNNYNNRKEFLIDMACFPGSSGSPVFMCNETVYNYNNNVHLGIRCKLLGVLYAGPQHTETGDIIFERIATKPKVLINRMINLGIVIKAERILELENIIKNI